MSKPPNARLWLAALTLAASSVRAALIFVSASGRITLNSSADTTIPVGTPWMFELIYDTAAPDRDFELTTTPDPTFGRFVNGAAGVPAMTFFHYRVGTYEVTLDDAGDFAPFSNIEITFTAGVHAIDINLFATGLFPPLAGGTASFHADFNNFSHSIFTSDALPINTSISGVVLGVLEKPSVCRASAWRPSQRKEGRSTPRLASQISERWREVCACVRSVRTPH